MALKLRVKLGGVNNLSDARYAAGMGVEAIGFVINEESPGFLEPEAMNAITEWISGIEIVGESGARIPENYLDYKIDILEVTDPILLQHDTKQLLRMSANINSIADLPLLLKTNADLVEYFVVDITAADLPELGQELKSLAKLYPIFIATVLDAYNLHYVMEVIQPQGIELKGGIEERPGFTNYDGIADILELLEEY